MGPVLPEHRGPWQEPPPAAHGWDAAGDAAEAPLSPPSSGSEGPRVEDHHLVQRAAQVVASDRLAQQARGARMHAEDSPPRRSPPRGALSRHAPAGATGPPPGAFGAGVAAAAAASRRTAHHGGLAEHWLGSGGVRDVPRAAPRRPQARGARMHGEDSPPRHAPAGATGPPPGAPGAGFAAVAAASRRTAHHGGLAEHPLGSGGVGDVPRAAPRRPEAERQGGPGPRDDGERGAPGAAGEAAAPLAAEEASELARRLRQCCDDAEGQRGVLAGWLAHRPGGLPQLLAQLPEESVREDVRAALLGGDGDQARELVHAQLDERPDRTIFTPWEPSPQAPAPDKGCRLSGNACLLIVAVLSSVVLLTNIGRCLAPQEPEEGPAALHGREPAAAPPPPRPAGAAGRAGGSARQAERVPRAGERNGSRAVTVLPLAEGGLCRSAAPLPEAAPSRRWRLDPSWQSMCAKQWFSDKDHAHDYPRRDWCWVGYKSECHRHLKEHRPWGAIQAAAAERGATVPREVGPYDPLLGPALCDRREAGKARGFTRSETAAANAWFDRSVAVFVLNLETDLQRWESISARLEALNIEATHVAGVDMRHNASLEDAKAAGWVPSDYNFTAAQETSFSPKQQMGSILGTLGCASGHFKAQDAALASGAPLAVVLEDDVWLEEDFKVRLWSLVTEELPCDWNVVSLYSRCPYGRCVSKHLMKVDKDENEPAWGCHHGVNWGMQGVLYRTATLRAVQGPWKRTVFDEARPHCMDVDVALAAISDEVGYYAVPSVQDPGFLHEMDQGSARWDINMDAGGQSTLDTQGEPKGAARIQAV